MPRPTRTARTPGTPPALHARFAAQLAAVRADPAAPATTDTGDERGWLLSTGAVGVVEPFVTALPRGDADLTRFAGVGGLAATALLERLGPRRLADRQNAGPTLGALLSAAAAHPDDLEVHGYVVGPARSDERISAEGVDVYALPHLDVRDDHEDGCQCELLWYYLAERLEPDDAVAPPDEITARVNPWRPNEQCWRLWWD